MTDKERLEMIKGIQKRIKECQEKGQNVSNLHSDYVDWLLNRIEELELEVNDWREEVQKWQQFYKESEESHLETKELLYSAISENQRYKQALEFYADEEHYKEKLISEAQYDADGVCISNDEYAPPIIYFDRGEKARKALKGETK